jgi:hypothetical protein
MPIPRMEDGPSTVIAIGGFGSIIIAALGALLLGGGSGFVGAFIGMILGCAIQ